MNNIDKSTGEVFDKVYLMPQHINYGGEILKQLKYVRDTLKNENEPDKFARLDPDTLSMALMELTAIYESLSKWLADEKLHIADLKTELDFKFADCYIMYKNRKSETNETARMQAKMACIEEQRNLDKTKHSYDKVLGWKKSIGRYHDAVRSQLSYEKSMGDRSRGQV